MSVFVFTWMLVTTAVNGGAEMPDASPSAVQGDVCKDYLESLSSQQREQPSVLRRAVGCLAAQQEREIAYWKQTVGSTGVVLNEYVAVARDLFTALGELEAAGAPFESRAHDEWAASFSTLLASPDASPDDVISKLLTGLRISRLQSDSVEAFDATVTVGASEIPARVLRVGRVGMYFASQDGRRAGFWDRARQRWIDVPAALRGQIVRGADIAQKKAGLELLRLPVAAPSAVKVASANAVDAVMPGFVVAFTVPHEVLNDFDVARLDLGDQSSERMMARTLQNGRELDRLYELVEEDLDVLAEALGGFHAALDSYVLDSARSLTRLHTEPHVAWARDALATMQATPGSWLSPQQLRQFGLGQLEEIRAGRQIARFRYPVSRVDGRVVETSVVRVGTFNIVSSGHYLSYDPATRVLRELTRQPPLDGLIRSTTELLRSEGEVVPFGLDVAQNRVLEAFEKRQE